MVLSPPRSTGTFLDHEGTRFADVISPHTRDYTCQLADELDRIPGLAGTKADLDGLLDEPICDPHIGRQLAKEALDILLLSLRPFAVNRPSDVTLRQLRNNTKTLFAQTILNVMLQLPRKSPDFFPHFHTCHDAEPMMEQAVRGAVTAISAEKMPISARVCVLTDDAGTAVGIQKTDYEASVMPITTQPESGLFAGVFSEPLRSIEPSHFLAHCDIVEVPTTIYQGFRPLRPSSSTFDKKALRGLIAVADPYIDDQSQYDMVNFSDAAFATRALRLAKQAAPYGKTAFVGQ